MIEGVLHTTRGRILIGVVGVVLVVAVLFLTGVIGGNDYWDGGGYSGPVVNLAGEVTEEAHNELADCGYSDDDAKALTQGTSTRTARFSRLERSTRSRSPPESSRSAAKLPEQAVGADPGVARRRHLVD